MNQFSFAFLSSLTNLYGLYLDILRFLRHFIASCPRKGPATSSNSSNEAGPPENFCTGWLCHCHCMSLVWVSINVEHIEHSQSVQLSDWFLFLCLQMTTWLNLLANRVPASKWRATCFFPNWQHRYMGLYIIIYSLIKLLLLSTWLIFCMLLWVEILVAFFPIVPGKSEALR